MALQGKEIIAEAKKRAAQITAALKSMTLSIRRSKILSHMEKGLVVAGHTAGAFCGLTAAAVQEVLRQMRKSFGGVSSVSSRAGAVLLKGSHVVGGRVALLGRDVVSPFVKMVRAPKLILNGFRKNGIRGGATVFFSGMRNNRGFFTTILNYAAPVVGVMVLVNVVSAASNVSYALEITNDGQHIGYVEDESIFTNAQELLRQRIIRTDGSTATFELKPQMQLVQVNKSLIADVDKVTDGLIKMSKADVSEAEGLYIDGDFYGAVTDKTLLESILTKTLDSYRTGADGETVSFIKDIQLRDGLYLTDSLKSGEEMENLLLSNQQTEVTYTIVEGDSPILIADKNGIPYSEFKSLNPGIEKTCMIGQKALIATEKPFLSVKVIKNEVYSEDIPYEKETTEDNSQYKGYTKTVQTGEPGTKQITASVEYVDGYEVGREVLSTEVTQAAVNEKVVVGTKEKPAYRAGTVLSASTGNGQVSGNFIRPVNTGYVSCGYSGGHRALDFAVPYGTSIRAAAGGKVIVAGWYYTYGKCVVIDHGNGVQTLYAHNSSLNVSVGDYVSQGQVLAGAGSTGYSTGNHCHFEIKVGGSNRNPWNYIS